MSARWTWWPLCNFSLRYQRQDLYNILLDRAGEHQALGLRAPASINKVEEQLRRMGDTSLRPPYTHRQNHKHIWIKHQLFISDILPAWVHSGPKVETAHQWMNANHSAGPTSYHSTTQNTQALTADTAAMQTGAAVPSQRPDTNTDVYDSIHTKY